VSPKRDQQQRELATLAQLVTLAREAALDDDTSDETVEECLAILRERTAAMAIMQGAKA
jgi:hypothetical protein